MKDITLVALVRIALRNLIAIILCAIIFATAAFIYCRFITDPVYSATGSVLVTNGKIITSDNSPEGETITSSDISASINLSYTVRDILQNPGIFQKLEKEIGGKYSFQNLKGRITINQRADYSLFNDVSFSANSPEEAIELVNQYLKLVPEFINEFVPGSATVTTNAYAASKVSPQTTLVCFVAAVIGAAIAYIIAFIFYTSNTVIHNETDFKERFDIPVIGVVPDFSTARSEKYYKNYGEYFNGGNNNDE